MGLKGYMDIDRSEMESLLRTFESGTDQEISCKLSNFQKQYGDYSNIHLLHLFEKFPQLLATLCQRLATAPTWGEFDTIFDKIIEVAPDIKQLKCRFPYDFVKQGNSLTLFYSPRRADHLQKHGVEQVPTSATLASGVMCACELFGTDPNRIRTMVIKFMNNGVDMSQAYWLLSSSHSGKAIASILSSEQSRMART